MKAIIYKPAKNVMQSGRSGLDAWVLEFDRNVVRLPESLMGWTSSDATTGQVSLGFPDLEKAQDFAEKNNLDYIVKSSSVRKVRPRNFADNYKYEPFEEA